MCASSHVGWGEGRIERQREKGLGTPVRRWTRDSVSPNTDCKSDGRACCNVHQPGRFLSFGHDGTHTFFFFFWKGRCRQLEGRQSHGAQLGTSISQPGLAQPCHHLCLPWLHQGWRCKCFQLGFGGKRYLANWSVCPRAASCPCPRPRPPPPGCLPSCHQSPFPSSPPSGLSLPLQTLAILFGCTQDEVP